MYGTIAEGVFAYDVSGSDDGSSVLEVPRKRDSTLGNFRILGLRGVFVLCLYSLPSQNDMPF